MNLDLVALPKDTTGIYTIKGVENRMPERMLWLNPAAAVAFATIAPWVVVSDVFRTAESSLEAVKAKRGAQPPGYSAHNYGLAIDVDIEQSRIRLGDHGYGDVDGYVGLDHEASKGELDEAMEAVGFYCHRVDHLNGFEAWHYNYLGIGTEIDKERFRSTSGYIEAKIARLYGSEFKLGNMDVQSKLTELRMYHGEIDGIVGPRTRMAVEVFCRAWQLIVPSMLNSSSEASTRFKRTLAYVTAKRRVADQLQAVSQP